ncbi:MAG: tyrosine-type recombinase/integrase [Burkholderiaceae bacterium]|jgi:integrase|nr:tyrosine-type recombinase/integrase [Burkholderiaceae bacterium]
MTLYPSDSSFAVGGQHYEGFPILVDSSGAIVEVVLHFFVDELLGRSGAKDLKTWAAYGRHMYDYFGYLEERFEWDHIPAPGSGDVPPLSHWVRWCQVVAGNQPGYINHKRATVERFYEWAHRVGRIPTIPFTRHAAISASADARLVHASSTQGRRSTSSLYLREPRRLERVLTRGQIDSALKEARNPTHHAAFYLGLTAGLRAEELATFPVKCVSDCSKLSSKVRTVPVRLDPAYMSTKNDKARTVRISVACMNALWQYKAVVRPRLLARAPKREEHAPLFLTRSGRPFVDDGFVAPFARLGAKVGFHIHPHMLRHTFATHTLASLEDLKHAGKFRGSPLVTLMRLLGHDSITTTSRYTHLLDAIDDVYGTRYQAEIDALAKSYLDAGA